MNKASKYKGVNQEIKVYKGKIRKYWRARIRVLKHLGYFKTEEKAHQAYLKALRDRRKSSDLWWHKRTKKMDRCICNAH